MRDPDDYAFPVPADCDGWVGLTKREYFAAAALQGLLSNNPEFWLHTGPGLAVQLSDALIAALEKQL